VQSSSKCIRTVDVRFEKSSPWLPERPKLLTTQPLLTRDPEELRPNLRLSPNGTEIFINPRGNYC